VLGWTATILFSLMYVPQIYKTLKTNSVKDVSLPMFVMGFIANIIALCYAILINQPPLQIKYILALIVICIYIGIYFYVMKGKRNVANFK